MFRVLVKHSPPADPSVQASETERFRKLLIAMQESCSHGLDPQFSYGERQVFTGLRASVQEHEGLVLLRVFVLAEADDLYIFSEENELVIEGWVRDSSYYSIGGRDVRETVDRRFTRVYHLPWAIDPSSVRAVIKDCVLELTAQRAAVGTARNENMFIDCMVGGSVIDARSDRDADEWGGPGQMDR